MDDMKAMQQFEDALRAFWLSNRDPALYLEVFKALLAFPIDREEDWWAARLEFQEAVEFCRGAPHLDSIVLAHDEHRAATAHEHAAFVRLSAYEGPDDKYDRLEASWKDALARCRAARKRIREAHEALDAVLQRL